MRVVNKFSLETPRQGKEALASRYTYQVEKLKDGEYVYLRRPANLHNGFDFIVCIENYNFAKVRKHRRNNPKHEDIIKELRRKHKISPQKYKKLFVLLEKVYLCKNINKSMYQDLDFGKGLSVELLLKTVKWLFIEQDIRYWNYSGRDMLWEGIRKLKLSPSPKNK